MSQFHERLRRSKSLILANLRLDEATPHGSQLILAGQRYWRVVPCAGLTIR